MLKLKLEQHNNNLWCLWLKWTMKNVSLHEENHWTFITSNSMTNYFLLLRTYILLINTSNLLNMQYQEGDICSTVEKQFQQFYKGCILIIWCQVHILVDMVSLSAEKDNFKIVSNSFKFKTIEYSTKYKRQKLFRIWLLILLRGKNLVKTEWANRTIRIKLTLIHFKSVLPLNFPFPVFIWSKNMYTCKVLTFSQHIFYFSINTSFCAF